MNNKYQSSHDHMATEKSHDKQKRVKEIQQTWQSVKSKKRNEQLVVGRHSNFYLI